MVELSSRTPIVSASIHAPCSVDQRPGAARATPVSRAVRRALREGHLRRARARVLAAALAGIGTIAITASPTSLAQPHAPEAGRGDGSEGFVLRGIAADDESGTRVSAAGDVNGDGVNDLIIGSPYASYRGRAEVGESYVVFGRASGFPPAFELHSLRPDAGGDGSEGFVLRGVDAGDVSGWVHTAGDLNGDGLDDLVIGVSRASPHGQHFAGECYVVFGRRSGFPPVFALASLFPGAGGDGGEGFVLIGIDAYDGAGRPARAAGDVNGDGFDDLVVGADGADPNGKREAGESYVVFGRAGGFPAVFELRSLTPGGGGDGSAGFILKGIDEYDSSGGSVAGAGDVNGDGVDDLIIGANLADPVARSYAGESYLVFGRTSGFPAAIELASLLPGAGGDGSTGVVLRGIDRLDQSGVSVGAAGDVNGDGIDDVIIGAPVADPNGSSAGQSYVVFGRASGFPAVLELSNLLPGSPGGGNGTGFVLNGIEEGDTSGRSVGAAGDVNGDGMDDLIIGANNADAYRRGDVGESYVVFGRTSGFPATFELRRLFPAEGGDGGEGFVMTGIDRFDGSGRSVGTLGDVNADGLDDLIIGAPYADPNGPFSGESYVVFGRASGFPAVFELSGLLPP